MEKKKEGICVNDILTAAAYICCRYEREFGGKIDEMKLQAAII